MLGAKHIQLSLRDERIGRQFVGYFGLCHSKSSVSELIQQD
jgi:hypothetical protein